MRPANGTGKRFLLRLQRQRLVDLNVDTDRHFAWPALFQVFRSRNCNESHDVVEAGDINTHPEILKYKGTYTEDRPNECPQHYSAEALKLSKSGFVS